MNPFVKPIDPISERNSGINRILNYIVDNPGATARDMADTLGFEIQMVHNSLNRLQVNGHIRRAPRGPDDRRIRWEAGPDEDYEKRQAEFGKPKQTTVTEWEPCTVREPLIDFLFGRQV